MSCSARIIGGIWLAVLAAGSVGCGTSQSRSTPRSQSGSTSRSATPASPSSVTTTTDGAPKAKPFNLASTLDGKTVLPHRIHWLGLPALSASKVKAVDFLIDGRLAWVEQKAPYSYADDGGYLVTSFLAPGRHRFTIRAIPFAGHSATDTVTARVLPAPPVPAALAGTWQRKISDTSSAPAPGSPDNPTSTLTPPGTYKITFDRRWIHDEFPCTNSPCTFQSSTGAGTEFDSDWDHGPTTFHVQGEVTFRMFTDTDRLAGWWCQTWGPPATYTWSVSGKTLKLAPVGGHDACGIRGSVWSGTWTRPA
jgi:hypothetical protein